MPDTRSQHEVTAPKTYILDFFLDDQGGCALTARINDTRFHIVVDPSSLKSKTSSDVLNHYQKRLRAVKGKDDNAEEASDNTSHTDTKGSTGSDSGVDITADESQSGAETDLQNWILSCFAEQTAELAPESGGDSLSVEEWYNVPVHYFEVEAKEDALQPKPLEENANFSKRMDDLIPSLPLPKTLRQLTIPHLSPSHLTVLSTSDNPPPVHPSVVRSSKDNKTYFFKPVDPTQPQPTKREIEYHHKLESKNLYHELKVPKLEGLIFVPGSKINIMGMILTLIEEPTPLTLLLDSEVDESNRQRWAKETKHVVQRLHENGIVWGDAKADNFMVDKHDDLWIIDFGGSYTEGWVSPDNMETEEGDMEGTDKIVNALHDPEGATFDMEEEEKEKRREEEEEGAPSREPKPSGKREREDDGKNDADSVENVEAEPTAKRARHEESQKSGDESDDGEQKYCLCNGPSSGKMVACDGTKCSREWFHLECVGLDSVPTVEKWFCDDCEETRS